jgi:hypothetical protein
MKVGQQSRIKDTGFLARNVAPALVTDILRGDTPGEAGALYSTMTQAIVDPTGEKSRTAIVQLADQLKELLPEKASTRERIEAIQQSKTLQDKVIPELKLEAAAKGPMEAFLKGQGKTADTYKAYLASATTMQENAAMLDEQIRLIRGTPLQQTSTIDRSAKTAVEALAMADPEAARLGALREQFKPLMQQAGTGWLGGKVKQLEVIASGDELEDYVKTLKLEANTLMNPREMRPMTGMGTPTTTYIQPTAEDVSKGKTLLELVRIIEETEIEATPQKPATPPLSDDAARQLAAVNQAPVVPVPAAVPDPRVDKTNELLDRLNTTMERAVSGGSRNTGPRPISPPFEEDR